MSQYISNSFKKAFLSRELSEQITSCDRNELASLFYDLFKDNQPVLEAGCGSGKWCAWFTKQGIRSDGVDWSQELCERAKKEIPECKFVACDMQSTPFEDNTYGGVLALGSVEHLIQGPQAALKEFYRLLLPNGIAVITVPYGGPLRRTFRLLSSPVLWMKASLMIRRFFGKPFHGNSLGNARKKTFSEWFPRFRFGDKGWCFYEYEFNKKQMRIFLSQAGLVIVKEFVAFGDEGIIHNFGRIAGKWNQDRGCVDLKFIGRILKKFIPTYLMGHMLCYVVKKNA